MNQLLESTPTPTPFQGITELQKVRLDTQITEFEKLEKVLQRV